MGEAPNAEFSSAYREVVGLLVVVDDYASIRIAFKIALTATSSFWAAATRRVRANFEIWAGPAALWIAERSSAVSRKTSA
jgi:hypothetical protein